MALNRANFTHLLIYGGLGLPSQGVVTLADGILEKSDGAWKLNALLKLVENDDRDDTKECWLLAGDHHCGEW